MQGKLSKFLVTILIVISFSLIGVGIWTFSTKERAIEDLKVESVASNPKYTLNGTIDWESHQPYIGDKYGQVEYNSSNAKNNYVVNMYTSGYSGSGIANNGKEFNYKSVTITAFIMNYKSWHNPNYRTAHESYTLTRDGVKVSNGALYGTGNVTLYSGALSNGNYKLEYVCRAETNGAGYYLDKFTYTFSVDNVAPTINLKTIEGKNLTTGSLVNEQVVAKATDSSTMTLYYKEPNGSYKANHENTFYITSTSKNGTYSFYAVDRYGNQSDEVSITYDNTAPTGKFFTDSGVTTNYYVNKPFSFKAEDNMEIDQILMKKPNSADWVNYQNNTQVTDIAGEYKFKVIDKAGNQSKEYAIFFDNIPPVIKLVVDSSELYDEIYTNSNNIRFETSDNVIGDIEIYIKKPNSQTFERYVNQSLLQDGRYEYYCIDSVGNESEKGHFIIDRTAPTLKVKVGEEETDKSFLSGHNLNFTAKDNLLDKVSIYIKKPGSSSFVLYEDGERLALDGEYQVYAVDGLGNRSENKVITVDNEKPITKIFADGVQTNDKYKNANTVSFDAEDTSLFEMYVKIPNSESFTKYSSGIAYSLSGKYEFYAVDKAGNESEKVSIVIDRDIDKIEMQGVVGSIANGNVIITWIDKNIDENAPIKRVLVNGIEYDKGSTIYTVKNGVYRVQVFDMAGNSYEESFVSKKDNISEKTYNQEWWESTTKDNERLSFDSLEKAMDFALAREKGFVETGIWSNPNEWDIGIPMDSIDSENAKLGTYYVYKESGNPSRVVAYFTEERLNEVLREYAKRSIEHYYYYEKNPEKASEGNSVTILSDNGKVIIDSITFEKGNKITIDNEVFEGEIYSEEGEHKVVIEDNYGNKTEYTLVIVRHLPTIEYCTEKGEWKELADKREVYLPCSTSFRVKDNLDSFAMLETVDENSNISKLSRDQIVSFSESGKYTLFSVNHYGKSEKINVYISKESENIQFVKDTLGKKFDVKISRSTDKYVQIESIKIYKKVDAEWVLLEKDDYGALIQKVKLDYSFRSSGEYKVVVEDNFRKGEFAVTSEYSYVQPNPEFSLKGVKENGVTNGNVIIDWKDEIVVTILKNGKSFNYTKGQAIDSEGVYKVTIKNYDKYEKVFEFVIDKTNPKLALDGVENKGKTNKNVAVTIHETDLDITVFIDGKQVDRSVINAVLSKDGLYKIVAVDKAGNSTIFEFEIDKTPPEIFIEKLGDNGVIKGDTFISSFDKDITIKVYLNGEQIDYQLGDKLSELGEYRVVVLDSLGNSSEYNFTLEYGLSIVSIALIIVSLVIAILIVVFVLGYRKKKLGYIFKKKDKKGKN